jgi:hypothetical protein
MLKESKESHGAVILFCYQYNIARANFSVDYRYHGNLVQYGKGPLAKRAHSWTFRLL